MALVGPSFANVRRNDRSLMCVHPFLPKHARGCRQPWLEKRDAQRGYRHAIDEFIEWYCSEPRLSFNRSVVLR